MKSLGLPFEAVPVDADESVPPGLSPADAVKEIARRKLAAGLEASESRAASWGIAADTMVEGPEGLLGKPKDAREAEGMIASLSGRTHSVHSGIAVFAPGPFRRIEPVGAPDGKGSAIWEPAETVGPWKADGSGTICLLCHSTSVSFRSLTDGEIRSYVATNEWRGAAGAYRIQGKGAVLVERIDGLWSTVVGLPLAPLSAILSALSYPSG